MYPDPFLIKLQNIFLGLVNLAVEKEPPAVIVEVNDATILRILITWLSKPIPSVTEVLASFCVCVCLRPRLSQQRTLMGLQ